VTPQDLRALINRGIALRDLKRHDEAVAAYNRALVLNPDSTEALHQLGNLFAAQDKSAEAVVQFERALLVKPDHVGALERLVSVLLGQNEYPRALGVVMRTLNFAETAAAKGLFVLCVRGRPLASDDGNIRALVLRALTEPWDRPADVSTAATSLVKLNPVTRASCAWPANAGSEPAPVEALSGDLAAIADDSLLRSLIETVPVYDIELERFLTKLRSVLLEVAVASVGTTVDDRLLHAGCALARQCFINEYAFDETAAETGRVGSLCAQILGAAQHGDSIPALWVAAAAAYMPLHSLPVADALMEKTWPQTVVELLAQQIGEPREEQRLRQSIPRLTAIADDVSIKVKQQYEENPYPRWIKPAPAREAMSVADYFSSLFGLSGAGSQRDSVDILVAGCGTGQRLVETARQFKGAQVLAIDLSLASLAYARRQVEALGLDNVEFAEADILNMGTMDRTFDIVDASGVLHHLSDPWAGWRALLARLRAGGFMEVCLYSALARRDINAARAFVAERGYRPSAPDIRRCRQDILASGTAWAKSVANCRDFFATSECRDLLFQSRSIRWHCRRSRLFSPRAMPTSSGSTSIPASSRSSRRDFQRSARSTTSVCGTCSRRRTPTRSLRCIACGCASGLEDLQPVWEQFYYLAATSNTTYSLNANTNLLSLGHPGRRQREWNARREYLLLRSGRHQLRATNSTGVPSSRSPQHRCDHGVRVARMTSGASAASSAANFSMVAGSMPVER
jgi:SAM-dependent methyltransferase